MHEKKIPLLTNLPPCFKAFLAVTSGLVHQLPMAAGQHFWDVKFQIRCCRGQRPPHLPSVLVHHVEVGVVLRLPAYPIRNGFATELGGDDLQQVQLEGLLDENDVVFSHS